MNKVKTFGVKLVIVHNVPLTRVKDIVVDSVELCGGKIEDDVYMLMIDISIDMRYQKDILQSFLALGMLLISSV